MLEKHTRNTPTSMNILLVHGLGRTPCSMFRLGTALRRAGHRTGYFGYSPTFESLTGILALPCHEAAGWCDPANWSGSRLIRRRIARARHFSKCRNFAFAISS